MKYWKYRISIYRLKKKYRKKKYRIRSYIRKKKIKKKVSHFIKQYDIDLYATEIDGKPAYENFIWLYAHIEIFKGLFDQRIYGKFVSNTSNRQEHRQEWRKVYKRIQYLRYKKFHFLPIRLFYLPRNLTTLGELAEKYKEGTLLPFLKDLAIKCYGRDIYEHRKYILKEIKMKVFGRDKGKCQLCGSNENLVYDHIIPYAWGGSNKEENLQLLCGSCNFKKSDKFNPNYALKNPHLLREDVRNVMINNIKEQFHIL